MIKTFYISERFFTEQELTSFREEHGYDIKEISYSGYEEEDFSVPHQKEFLLKYGTPKILARFGY
jgi:hypothetical protein